MNEKDLVSCPDCRTTFISKEKFDEHDRTECDTIQYETAEDKSVRIAQESEREDWLNECESLANNLTEIVRQIKRGEVKIADIRGFLQQFKKTIDKLKTVAGRVLNR